MPGPSPPVGDWESPSPGAFPPASESCTLERCETKHSLMSSHRPRPEFCEFFCEICTILFEKKIFEINAKFELFLVLEKKEMRNFCSLNTGSSLDPTYHYLPS